MWGSIRKCRIKVKHSKRNIVHQIILPSRLGGAVFRLQDYYVKDWAENFMMKFDVEDVDAWHEHVRHVLAQTTYAHARVAEPEMVGDTKILHVWDPCGVLLIFLQ
jgi:hypothetical protein